jgi:acyl-CoA reductase-like NAD-dependent aldehyde dehydrogenase
MSISASVRALDTSDHHSHLFIGGEWSGSPSTETVDVVCLDTQEIIARTVGRNHGDVDRVVAAVMDLVPQVRALIREDADLELAVYVMQSAFCNAGQMCGALSASARQGLHGRLPLRSRDD